MICYWRFIFAIMGFLGLVIVYMLRVNLSVAIVAMVNSTVFKPKNLTVECPSNENNNSRNTKSFIGEFLWSEDEQTMLLSAFYWGYTLMQIPSGILLLFFRAKWIYGLSTLTTSILTLFIPLAANNGIYSIVVLRFLMGLCEGPTFPALYALCGRWILRKESSILVTCIISGSSIGTIVGQGLSGVLIEIYGWEWLFYIMASFGCVWFLLYAFLVYEKPSVHPFISDYEKQLLISSLPHNQPDYQPKRVQIPWKKVFTSKPYFGYLIFGAGFNFTWYTMINCLPLYIGTVLGFNISENGGISSLPYIALMLFSLTAGMFQDFIKSKNVISTTKLRKMIGCFGMMSASIILFNIIFCGCDIPLTVALVCVGIAFLGFSSSVCSVNLLDIAPAYAGTLLSICNVCNSLCGIIAPYVKGIYTKHGETRANWENVFITSSSILFIGAVTYAVFGSATLQPWANLESDTSYLIDSDSSDVEYVSEDKFFPGEHKANIQ